MKQSLPIPLMIIVTALFLSLGPTAPLHAKRRSRLGYAAYKATRAEAEEPLEADPAILYQQADDFTYAQTPSERWQTTAPAESVPGATEAVVMEAARPTAETVYFDITTADPATTMVRASHTTAVVPEPADHEQPTPTISRYTQTLATRQPSIGQQLAAMGDGQLVDVLGTDRPLQLQQLSAQERGQLHNRLKSLVDRLNQRLAQIQAYDAAAPQ